MKEENLEFFKLDTIDRRVVFIILEKNPKSLKSYIAWLAKYYTTKRNIVIDNEELFKEISESGFSDRRLTS